MCVCVCVCVCVYCLVMLLPRLDHVCCEQDCFRKTKFSVLISVYFVFNINKKKNKENEKVLNKCSV